MVPLWELLHAAEPYAKTIEYALIFATVIAAIYASRKIGTGAKKIEDLETKIEDLETRLVDLSSKMRQAAAESAEELENSIEKLDEEVRARNGADASEYAVAACRPC